MLKKLKLISTLLFFSLFALSIYLLMSINTEVNKEDVDNKYVGSVFTNKGDLVLLSGMDVCVGNLSLSCFLNEKVSYKIKSSRFIEEGCVGCLKEDDIKNISFYYEPSGKRDFIVEGFKLVEPKGSFFIKMFNKPYGLYILSSGGEFYEISESDFKNIFLSGKVYSLYGIVFNNFLDEGKIDITECIISKKVEDILNGEEYFIDTLFVSSSVCDNKYGSGYTYNIDFYSFSDYLKYLFIKSRVGVN